MSTAKVKGNILPLPKNVDKLVYFVLWPSEDHWYREFVPLWKELFLQSVHFLIDDSNINCIPLFFSACYAHLQRWHALAVKYPYFLLSSNCTRIVACLDTVWTETSSRVWRGWTCKISLNVTCVLTVSIQPFKICNLHNCLKVTSTLNFNVNFIGEFI